MKRIILAFLICSFSIAATAQTVINDPNAEVRTLSGSFTAIKVSGGIDLYLSQSGSEGVAVSSNKLKQRDHIKTEVRNNTLFIWFDAPGGLRITVGDLKMKAYVSFKDLEKIDASGSTDIDLDGELKGTSFALEMSGASEFTGKVALTNMSLDVSGASHLHISGVATNVNIDASGASEVKAYDLVTDVCNAKASGASDISITVNKELIVNTKGASDINYKGSPVIKELHTKGSGNVNKKG